MRDETWGLPLHGIVLYPRTAALLLLEALSKSSSELWVPFQVTTVDFSGHSQLSEWAEQRRRKR